MRLLLKQTRYKKDFIVGSFISTYMLKALHKRKASFCENSVARMWTKVNGVRQGEIYPKRNKTKKVLWSKGAKNRTARNFQDSGFCVGWSVSVIRQGKNLTKWKNSYLRILKRSVKIEPPAKSKTAKIPGSPAKKLTKCQVFLRGRRIEGIYARRSRLAKYWQMALRVRFIRNEIKPKRFYEVKVLKKQIQGEGGSDELSPQPLLTAVAER